MNAPEQPARGTAESPSPLPRKKNRLFFRESIAGFGVPIAAISLAVVAVSAMSVPSEFDKPPASEAELSARVDQIFKKYDKNRNGFLERSEFGDKHQERFDVIDTNRDDKVSQPELKAWFERRLDRHEHPGKNIGRGRGKGHMKV